MSSSNAENVTAAVNQDAHHIVSEEAAEDIIVNIALRQGASKKLTTS